MSAPRKTMSFRGILKYFGFLIVFQQAAMVFYSFGLPAPLFENKMLSKLLHAGTGRSSGMLPNTPGELLIFPYRTVERISRGGSTADYSVTLTKMSKEKFATDIILKELEALLSREDKKIMLAFTEVSVFYAAGLIFSDYPVSRKIYDFCNVGLNDLSKIALDTDTQVLYVFTEDESLDARKLEELFAGKGYKFARVSAVEHAGRVRVFVYKTI